MIGNLLKAAVATVLAPVAVVVDVVRLPATAMDPSAGPFEATGHLLNAAKENVREAIKK